MSESLWPHGLYSPWSSLGQNTGVGSLSLLQGIFPTQGSNPSFQHYGQILYQLSHKGSPTIFVNKLFSYSGFFSLGPTPGSGAAKLKSIPFLRFLIYFDTLLTRRVIPIKVRSISQQSTAQHSLICFLFAKLGIKKCYIIVLISILWWLLLSLNNSSYLWLFLIYLYYCLLCNFLRFYQFVWVLDVLKF